MSVRIEMDMPESAFPALRVTPQQFASELRPAAAMQWYEAELVSRSKAAEIAGMRRSEFIDALVRYRVPVIQITPEQLEDEVRRG